MCGSFLLDMNHSLETSESSLQEAKQDYESRLRLVLLERAQLKEQTDQLSQLLASALDVAEK